MNEPEVNLPTQLQCARRELAMRKRVYPNFVGAKRMTQFKADDEIRWMEAIVKTLEGLVAQSSPK
jgi:hypothetical protein